jgi:hypothetical protein
MNERPLIGAVMAKQYSAGPPESESVSGFVEAMARQENQSKAEIEKDFFKNCTVVVSAEAVCDRG